MGHSFFLFLLTETMTKFVTQEDHDALNAKFEALKDDFLNSQKSELS